MGARWRYGKRGYAIAGSLRHLARHRVASVFTLLVLGITLTLPALMLYASTTLAHLSGGRLQDQSLTVYLSLALNDLDGAALATRLAGRPGIRDTRYISRDEALETLRQHTDIDDALAALGDNPLPGAIVVFPDIERVRNDRLSQLADSLAAMPEVERVQFDLRWVQRLQAVLSLVRTLGLLLAGFLTLTALLVIGNTIRLELLRRRDELDVCGLLGASRAFLNRPMIYTGALYGFLAGLIAGLAAWASMTLLRQPVDTLATLYASDTTLLMPEATQFLAILAVATLLGIMGALFTLYRPSRHLFSQ